MTRSIFSAVVFLLLACRAAAEEPRTFTHAPTGDEGADVPWRIVLRPDGKVESQHLMSGIRHGRIEQAKVLDDRIEIARPGAGLTLTLRRQPDGTLLLHVDGSKDDLVFAPSREWDEKFEQAIPAPRTKAEAIATLRKVLEPADQEKVRAMKRDDLILLHFPFGMWLRNALGLWEKDSPLRDDLGGGHPDDASMRLIEAFWEDLQKDGGGKR